MGLVNRSRRSVGSCIGSFVCSLVYSFVYCVRSGWKVYLFVGVVSVSCVAALAVAQNDDSCEQSVELLLKAQAAQNSGKDLATIAELYRKAKELCPSSFEARYNWGVALYKLGRYGEALQELEEAAKIEAGGANPNNPSIANLNANSNANSNSGNVYIAMGNAHLAEKKYQQAISQYQVALKRDENNIDALLGIAAGYERSSQHELAEKHLLQALSLKPNNYQVLFNLGLLKEKTGALEEAVKYYQQASDVAKTDSAPLVRWATVLVEIAKRKDAPLKLEEAKSVISRAKINSPENPEVLITQALLLEQEGNFQGAKDSVEPLYLKGGRDKAMLAILAIAYVQLDADAKAFAMIEEAKGIFKDDPQILNAEGWYYLQNRDWQKAEEIFNEVLRLDPKNVTAHKNLAILYRIEGNKEKSAEHDRLSH